MSFTSNLCAEIRRPNMLVTVDGIVIQKRTVGSNWKRNDRVPLCFTIKDVLGDTANIVIWDRPEEILKIGRLIRFGSAFRFASLKSSLPHPNSMKFYPRTSCAFVLQMRKWSVETLVKQTEDKLLQICKVPTPGVELTQIRELLLAQKGGLVSLMGLVISVGIIREVKLHNGEVHSTLAVEIAENSSGSILVTFWGQELVVFVKEQLLPWESVIHLKDATLKCYQDRTNQIHARSQTLVTLNVTGNSSTMMQRILEKARFEGFKPTKIFEVPKATPKVNPNLPPQWVTLEVFKQFYERGVWPDHIDPFRPMASILILLQIDTITEKLVCPKCGKIVKKGNDQAAINCEKCALTIKSDCRQLSVSANFGDQHGGMKFYFTNADLVRVLGCRPQSIPERELVERLDQQSFRRFKIVFQILDFASHDHSLIVSTIKLCEPTSDDWEIYSQVAE